MSKPSIMMDNALKNAEDAKLEIQKLTSAYNRDMKKQMDRLNLALETISAVVLVGETT